MCLTASAVPFIRSAFPLPNSKTKPNLPLPTTSKPSFSNRLHVNKMKLKVTCIQSEEIDAIILRSARMDVDIRWVHLSCTSCAILFPQKPTCDFPGWQRTELCWVSTSDTMYSVIFHKGQIELSRFGNILGRKKTQKPNTLNATMRQEQKDAGLSRALRL